MTSVSIGTPLSASAKKVLLCGAGELGKEVIIELQRLGVEVIAVDRYANAPAMQVAHRSHVINMLDGEALRAVIELETARPDRAGNRGHRHRHAGRAGSRGLHRHSHRESHAADHEPRGHSSPGGRRTGAENQCVSLRANERRIPGRRSKTSACPVWSNPS